MRINRQYWNADFSKKVFLFDSRNRKYITWNPIIQIKNGVKEEVKFSDMLVIVFGIFVIFGIAFLGSYSWNQGHIFQKDHIEITAILDDKYISSENSNRGVRSNSYHLYYEYTFGNNMYYAELRETRLIYDESIIGSTRQIYILPYEPWNVIFDLEEMWSKINLRVFVAILGVLLLSLWQVIGLWLLFEPVFLVEGQITNIEFTNSILNKLKYMISCEFFLPNTKIKVTKQFFPSIKDSKNLPKVGQTISIIFHEETNFIIL